MSNPGPFLIQPLVPKPIKEGEPITLFSSAFGNDGDQNTMFMGKNQTGKLLFRFLVNLSW